MRIESLIAGVLACTWLLAGAVTGQKQRTVRLDRTTVALEQRFFYRLDLGASGAQADAMLRQDPANSVALFVRMEIAELEDRSDHVLDSALGLCRARAPADFQEVASNRILEHAANTKAFNAVLEQLEARALNGPCALNLRLALVKAASDGSRFLDLDDTASAAGLLTEWRIAGPFGRFTNVDIGRHWPPESDQLSLASYGQRVAEDFRFRDGKIALPDYLTGPGVFYAATEATASRAGAFRLDVFAAGPYVAYLDGRPTLLHDSPYLPRTGHDSVSLRLQAGKHRVMLKFTSDAAPLRVVWHEETTTTGLGSQANGRQPLHVYAGILESYFRQDFASVESRLNSVMCQRAVACEYLRAMLQSASGRQSPRMAARWQAVLKAEPDALLAELKIRQAAADLNASDDEARQQATVVALNHPQSETAARLAFKLSRPKPEEGEGLILHLLELHPSCAYLAQAVEFDNLWGDLSHAQAAERQLEGCAPLSLDYARALAQTGRHSAAARALEKIITVNPLDRPARRLLIEELVLNSQPQLARDQARELHRIAPNAPNFLRLAEDPEVAIDGNTPRAQGLAAKKDFYVPYRRDGLALIRNSPAPADAAASAMTLLADQVIELGQDDSVSVYVHTIRRLFNKESLNAYGEVSLPAGASILELRTVKGSGQIIEPELEFDTGSVAMPALDPGDSIEEEYVNHYSGWDQTPREVFRFEFGSFVAPVLASRLVLITPTGSRISFSGQNGAPSGHSEQAEGKTIQTWERGDIPAADAESFLPGGRLLPTVTITRADDVGDRLRDQLIGATRAGPNVLEAAEALRLRLGPASGERARAKLLYSFVKQTIESDGSDWTTNSADDSLLKGRGSRTLALLALARLSGMRAGLVLARQIDHACGQDLDPQCYSQPLVRFWIGRGVADVDAEADDLPFGVVPPTLASSDALVLGALATDESLAEVASLAINQAVEKTRADGDLWLNDRGDLTARIQVRLGATRSQELRSQMRGEPRERQSFFEQFARRIFPDSVEITGSVFDEHDPEQSLEITVRCAVPQFVNLKGGAADIGQLAPALGLRGTFLRTATRRFPLYTGSLFFESTLFRLHLPPGIDLRSLPQGFAIRSEFGDYSVHFASTGRQIVIRREFRIPVQRIEPDKYPAFDVFARQIDDAERQQISLGASGYASSAPSSSKLRLITNK